MRTRSSFIHNMDDERSSQHQIHTRFNDRCYKSTKTGIYRLGERKGRNEESLTCETHTRTHMYLDECSTYTQEASVANTTTRLAVLLLQRVRTCVVVVEEEKPLELEQQQQAVRCQSMCKDRVSRVSKSKRASSTEAEEIRACEAEAAVAAAT